MGDRDIINPKPHLDFKSVPAPPGKLPRLFMGHGARSNLQIPSLGFPMLSEGETSLGSTARLASPTDGTTTWFRPLHHVYRII